MRFLSLSCFNGTFYFRVKSGLQVPQEVQGRRDSLEPR